MPTGISAIQAIEMRDIRIGATLATLDAFNFHGVIAID
jgi:hypothetical protein